jgi:hypothetical protein
MARWGTGALNIDGTRIGMDGAAVRDAAPQPRYPDDATGRWPGRWPANVVLGCCGNEPHDPGCAAAMLDEQTGETTSSDRPRFNKARDEVFFGQTDTRDRITGGYTDTGGASRFLYVAKASREERERGLEHRSRKAILWSSGEQSPGTFQAEGTDRISTNPHPTVKPVELMRWLCRLVTPPGGTVLDPFTGSGSTGIAALREGFEFIGIEREADYVEIAQARIVGDAPLFNTVEVA